MDLKFELAKVNENFMKVAPKDIIDLFKRQAYQEILPKIRDLGAQLVGISPELPDNSMSLVEKYSLKFEILSDIDNKLANKFGLTYYVEEEL